MMNVILQFVHKDLFLVLRQHSLDIKNVLIIDLTLLPLLLHYNLSELEKVRGIRGDYPNYKKIHLPLSMLDIGWSHCAQ